MIKRAGIYIRVSSERQAEKVSPQVQELDCRTYCEAHGYQVIGVYRDIERYRVGKKLVDPSGTRSDRPQFKQMLTDCANNTLDVIIAWKEDRLYRSIRSMLDLIDCIEKYKVDVELVKETFDRQMAPIKAAIARMELTSKDERTKMGMHGRLEQGKVWANLPFGYRKEGDVALVEPDEAKWVESIWKWYADGLGLERYGSYWYQLVQVKGPKGKRAFPGGYQSFTAFFITKVIIAESRLLSGMAEDLKFHCRF